MARPARIELAAPRLGALAKEATRGSVTPLPLILLAFCQAPDHPRPPRAATDCQPFVSRLADRRSSAERTTRSKPPAVHRLQKFSGDRVARCRSDHGIDSTPWAKRCLSFVAPRGDLARCELREAVEAPAHVAFQRMRPVPHRRRVRDVEVNRIHAELKPILDDGGGQLYGFRPSQP